MSHKLGADMLIMGSHHHGALYWLMHGDTAAEAATQAQCQLLGIPLVALLGLALKCLDGGTVSVVAKNYRFDAFGFPEKILGHYAIFGLRQPGVRVAAEPPTQSASVETSRSTPSRGWTSL